MKGKIIAIVVLVIIAGGIAWYLLKGNSLIAAASADGDATDTVNGKTVTGATPVQILRGDEVSDPNAVNPRANAGSGHTTGIYRQ